VGLADADEINAFEETLQSFLDGRIDPERFTAMRLQQGIYGQRQEGVNMVRVKVPGGRLDVAQLEALADVVERWSQHGLGHITTRQDIQVHYVPLAETPAVMRRLGEAGLTTREACGNTIRNVTACPLAGVCPREHTDVRTHLDGAVEHFLRNPLNQQMPRKFKVSFSGCESDCAQAMLHDMGVVAVHQDGKFGFKVLAAGGLGHKPHEAIVVESFVEEADLIPVMEAVVALHNRYSDRTKRAKSRIKFLVDKFGVDGFLEKYREELARTRPALAGKSVPVGQWKAGAKTEAPGPGAPRQIFAQKQVGRVSVPVGVPLGDLNPVQLRGLARILSAFGLSEARTTQDQNLIVPDVPRDQVDKLLNEVASLGLALPRAGDNVVACPGTSTCRLGITSSTLLAPKLTSGEHDLRIRVSGCHNGCAQPETGDIGIYGEGRRQHGKLVPHYQTYFGGNGMGGGALALKGPSVPAARIEPALARVRGEYSRTRDGEESFFDWSRRQGAGYFKTLLADLTEVRAEDIAQVLRDHGDGADFRVLQLGGGECAGAVQVQIGSSFFEAAHERAYRDAFVFQRKWPEAVGCAQAMIRVVGQGLAQLVGGQKHEDTVEQAAELRNALPAQAGLADSLAGFAKQLAAAEDSADGVGLTDLFRAVDQWLGEVAEVATRHDPQLDLRDALPKVLRGVAVAGQVAGTP
jgi:sulfite reductase (NADPH) hemoprotein beta-component